MPAESGPVAVELSAEAAEEFEGDAGEPIARATLEKNSEAIRFETLVSMRCPTPPTMPPTVALAE